MIFKRSPKLCFGGAKKNFQFFWSALEIFDFKVCETLKNRRFFKQRKCIAFSPASFRGSGKPLKNQRFLEPSNAKRLGPRNQRFRWHKNRRFL